MKLGNIFNASTQFLFFAVMVITLLFFSGSVFIISEANVNQYDTVPLTKQSINEEVIATGYIVIKDQVKLGAQVNGRILKMHAKMGDKVKKGQLLVEIDPVLQMKELETITSEGEILKATLNIQKIEARLRKYNLEKKQNSFEFLGTSEIEMETARAEYEAAVEQVRISQAKIKQHNVSLDKAKANLEFTKIKSPIDGSVLKRYVNEGQTITSSQITPNLMLLGNLNNLQVKLSISEQDVSKVFPDQKVLFKIASSDKTYQGRIDVVEMIPDGFEQESSSSTTSREPVYYTAYSKILEKQVNLRPGMMVNVHILLKQYNDINVLPISTLTKKNDSYFVYVLEANETIREREIDIGVHDAFYVEIKGGLSADSKVIRSPKELNQLPKERKGW